MMRASIRNVLPAILMMFALAAPAHAAQWVATSDSWFWIDLDSRTTQAGVTYYAEVHSAQGGVSPDVGGIAGGLTPELNHGINCTTGQVYSHIMTNNDEWMKSLDDENSTVEPQYAWVERTAETRAEALAETKRIICNR